MWGYPVLFSLIGMIWKRKQDERDGKQDGGQRAGLIIRGGCEIYMVVRLLGNR